MQSWFLPLALIKLLTLSGITLSLLCLRAKFSAARAKELEIDKSYRLLIAFSLVAIFSMGLFILILTTTLP